MSEAIKRRRGTTAEHAAFIGLEGEITVDTTKKTAVVHDGVTVGGVPLARADKTLPSGGAAGQVLAKASAADNDGAWVNRAVAERHIYGLTLSNNTSDAANRLNISPGSARDDANTVDLVRSTTITKRLHNAWSVGNEGGFLDTGTKAQNAWYHIWLIRRDSDGLVDALASLSATNPTMPAGWTAKRRIGAIGTDASAAIIPFRQYGDYFALVTPMAMVPNNTANNLAVLRTLNVPIGVKLLLKLWVAFNSPTNNCYFGLKDPDEGVAAIQDVDAYSPASAQSAAFVKDVYCNASGQIYSYSHRTDAVIVTSYIKGWSDHRGKAHNVGV